MADLTHSDAKQNRQEQDKQTTALRLCVTEAAEDALQNGIILSLRIM
jgi:hypothetical protein